jgi:predicted nucleic acid-binding protein
MTAEVFVDTGAWVALRYKRDGMHAKAVRALKQLRQAHMSLVTTDYVLAEAVTLMKARGAVDHAIELGEMLRDGSVARLMPIEGSHRDRAWELFVRFRRLRVGYVDCTSFAVMQSEGLTHAFTYDRDFRAAGFAVVGG